MSVLSIPEPLDLEGNININYEIFSDRFLNFLCSNNMTVLPEKTKITIFLTAVGTEARKIFDSFNLSVDDPAITLITVMDRFKSYCQSYKDNVLYFSFKFYSRTQSANENFDSYLDDILKLASSCQFDYERVVRDKIVSGLNNPSIREEIFVRGYTSLNEIIEFCKSNEKGYGLDVKHEIIENEIFVKNELPSDHTNSAMTDIADAETENYDVVSHSKVLPLTVSGNTILKENSMVTNHCLGNVENENDFAENTPMEVGNLKPTKDEVNLNGVNEINVEKAGEKYIVRLNKNPVQCISEEKKYGCPICQQKFTRFNFLQHLDSHNGEKRLRVCYICRKEFKSKEHLSSHVKEIHGGKLILKAVPRVYKCLFCPKEYMQLQSFISHLRSLHANKVNFKTAVHIGTVQCENY